MNVSVDIARIRNDEEYKKDVISALARSPHSAVLDTALGIYLIMSFFSLFLLLFGRYGQ